MTPTEVLFEFEEPLTFVFKDRDGQPLLAHSLCDEGMIARYLVAVTDPTVIDELKSGRLDILGALRQTRCWIADVGPSWKVEALWSVAFSAVPTDHLPEPGVMVSPDLEPIFRLRLIGTGVGPGRTSAADIRMAAQATESGLRGLARVALDEKKKAGQVPRDIRHYSDLPYLYSRAASFEIAFGRPRDRLPGLNDEVFAEMGGLLERGLSALRSDADEPAGVEGLDPEQTLQLFEAIKALTPPTRGDVSRVEIGGSLVDVLSGPRVLTRDDRIRSVQRIKASRTAPRKEEPFRTSGVIEEADQGILCFTLRQLEPSETSVAGGASELRFQFNDHLYDVVMDAFNSQERMVVVGEKVDAVYLALDIRLAIKVTNTGTEAEIIELE